MTDATLREPSNLHGGALVVGECGVLIRGPSGAGKTRLALATVAEARHTGHFARIVSDDRTLVFVRGDRLVARPHPAVAGLVERRGFGIVAELHELACVVALVVDLRHGWPDRIPTAEDRRTDVAGIRLPSLTVASDAATGDSASLVLAVLAALAPRRAPPISLANVAAMHKMAPTSNGRSGMFPAKA